MTGIRCILATLKSAAKDFGDDDGTSMAAAVSYYTVFSLPPLLVLILMLASVVVDERIVQEMITGEFAGMIGRESAATIGEMIANAKRPDSGGGIATGIGLAVLLVGAAGAFSALQNSLNRAWEVAPDPRKGGIRNFVLKRLLSFGMVLGIAFLLLVSLAVSAVLRAFGDVVSAHVGAAETVVAEVTSNLVSLIVITLLFAAILKVIPDAKVAWGDVWIGAFATALLFVIGKFAISFYLGRSDPGSPFGAAGSLAVILVWIYYSAMIVIFGAEFTQCWAARFGSGIEPTPGAVRVVASVAIADDGSVEAVKPRGDGADPGDSRGTA